MKTKTTQIMKTQLKIAFWAIVMFSFTINAQTYVYNETISSGMFFQDNGSQVANPVSDATNSSANCAKSGTVANWEQIQYFPSGSYTPVSGDKLYFSVYNPGNAGPGQIQFDYSNPTLTGQWGGNITYSSGSVTGWVEYSLDLSPHVGKNISKIIMLPAGESKTAVYVDNVYFGTKSAIVAQTYVYNDATASGMFIDGNGAEVNNPVSNAVNSSVKCARTGTGGWKKIEYFPTYTPASGDKLYFSIYNPNSIGIAANSQGGQIKFYYSSAPSTEQWGGNVNYTSGSVTGWVEYSLDLTDHVGKQINKILMYPGGSSSAVVYIDNIYFANNSVLSTNSVAQINDQVFISKEGKIQFNKEQTNTQLSVFDLTGKLILEEKINGVKGEKALNQKGIYIVRVKSEQGVSSQKIIF